MEIEPVRTINPVPIIEELPYLEDADKPLVIRYLCLLDEWSDLKDIIASDGRFTVGDKGGLAAHPAVKMKNDCEAKLLAMEDRLGLSPSARLKLGADAARQKKEEAGLAAFLDELEDD